MSIGSHTFPLFVVAAAVICVTPGPDMLYVIANGIGRGVSGGVVAALGMAAGMLVHTTLVVTGLSLLLTSLPAVFGAVRVVGAAYLLWISVQTLRGWKDASTPADRAQKSLIQVFLRALVVNVLNAEVAIFFLAFLPQFVSPESPSPRTELLLLGGIFLCIGLLVDTAVGVASGGARDLLTRNRSVGSAMNVMAGIVFGALGILQLVSIVVDHVYAR